MTDWLAQTLDAGAEIVTANRRLARHLVAVHATQQVARGSSVWRTPAIYAWPDWLTRLVDGAAATLDLPARISPAQSEVLWERALRRQVDDPLLRTGMLVRQMQAAWDRLRTWRVPLAECQEAARSADQHLFVRVATEYASLLAGERWVDDAGMPELAMQLVAARDTPVPRRVTFAGFDRITPAASDLLKFLREAGTSVQSAPAGAPAKERNLATFDTRVAELRAAGAWARAAAMANPAARIGIVVTNIAEDPVGAGRCVREGAVPGWQYAPSTLAGQVNVSLGSRLNDFPAVAIAMLALRWFTDELRTRDVSTLLLSGLLGSELGGDRARLELRLRDLPDRRWTPAMLLGALAGRGPATDRGGLSEQLAAFDAVRQNLPRRSPPPVWAEQFDTALHALGWPGPGHLDSEAFQLVNRWRDLLNDFAKLELVIASMTAHDAVGKLSSMAAAATYQPEALEARIQVLGPLEAAGMHFDRLWVAGLGAAQWPPAGRPLPLLAAELQRRYDMPDADPADTLEYAQRTLERLASSADDVIFSFARSDGQTSDHVATQLLQPLIFSSNDMVQDPGWHARRLWQQAGPPMAATDAVPAVAATETVGGGAATLQKQSEEPFGAFTYGRLGVRPLRPIMQGLARQLRGQLIHDALRRLYASLPARDSIAAWTADDRLRRARSAVRAALSEHRRFADGVLRELLDLERDRVERLLLHVTELDAKRQFDAVAAVELTVDACIYGASLRLRIDRIDRFNDGSVLLIDYKTGTRNSFLNQRGEPRNIQLIVYANAIDEPVCGLALLHVDTRAVALDGAGACFGAGDDWARMLESWNGQLKSAVADFLGGDVRVNVAWAIARSRPLALLSRVQELKHAD